MSCRRTDSEKSKKITVYIWPKVWYNSTMLEKKIKDNIIQFPLKRRQTEIEKEEFYEKSNQYDECVDLARYCVDLLTTGMNEQDFIDAPFEFDPIHNEEQHSDMFVILNLLVAVFLRNANIKHILQEDLDEMLTKIMSLEQTPNDFT